MSAKEIEQGKQELMVKKGTPIRKAAARSMRSPFEEMDRLFEPMLPRGWMRPFSREAPLLEMCAEWRQPS